MRQLRIHVNATVAQGWNRALPVQRLRPLPQDERHQQATHQTTETTGKIHRGTKCGLKLTYIHIQSKCIMAVFSFMISTSLIYL